MHIYDANYKPTYWRNLRLFDIVGAVVAHSTRLCAFVEAVVVDTIGSVGIVDALPSKFH